MARLTKVDMQRMAKSVCLSLKETGGIPEWLLAAVKEALEHASWGVRLEFVDELRERCPEAMKWFGDGESPP
jgi:hypothetical protein